MSEGSTACLLQDDVGKGEIQGFQRHKELRSGGQAGMI